MIPIKSTESPREPLYREIEEPQAFPIDALGEVLAPAVRSLVKAVKAPDSICAQSILAAASLAAQGHKNVTIDGRTYPISEYFLTIAASGERKSGVDEPALRAHVVWEKSKLSKYYSEFREFEQAQELFEHERGQAVAKGGCNLADGSSLGKPPCRPLSPNLLIEEPTYEGLVKLLEYNLPSIGIFSDEGGRFIGGAAMRQENLLKTISGFSNLWDGKAISRARAGDGTTKMYGRRLSAHLLVQPTVANLFLGNQVTNGQGFLARFLIAYPRSTMGTRKYEALFLSEDSSMQHYWSKMTALLNKPFLITEDSRGELAPESLQLTKGAHEVWVAFHDYIEFDLVDDGAYRPIAPFAGKCAEHVLRIAGILTVVNNFETSTISEDNLLAAITVVKFYLAEALRLHGSSQVSQDLIEAKALYDWIEDKGLRLVYPSLIYQKGPRFIRDKKRTFALLEILSNHGWLHRHGPKQIDGKMRQDVWGVVE